MYSYSKSLLGSPQQWHGTLVAQLQTAHKWLKQRIPTNIEMKRRAYNLMCSKCALHVNDASTFRTGQTTYFTASPVFMHFELVNVPSRITSALTDLSCILTLRQPRLSSPIREPATPRRRTFSLVNKSSAIASICFLFFSSLTYSLISLS